jgi:antirestriction protein ArdC
MQDEQNRSSNQPSLYSQVTYKIVAELELGIVPWVQPWGSGEGTIVLG